MKDNHPLTAIVALLAGVIALANPSSSQGQLSSLPPQPWPQNPVTISFAPDFVEIGRYRNELQQHFNAQLSNPDWQIEMLRAFQTWARHSDLQFAIAPDTQRAFGVPGLASGDPRFGDIRLGAFPQANVLGNAVAYHPSAGVWAGDIFLNTSTLFYIHDWTGGSSPPDRYDLYSVMLHEAGNSLGLIDSETDPESVMFFAYVGPRSELAPIDIADIQALYGAPSPDPYELKGNNNDFSLATPINYSGDFAKTRVATRRGRIQGASDLDFYRFEGNSLAENCWVKLRGRGHSLLCGRITVYDENFQEIATISAETPLRNSVGKEVTGIAPGETVYVAVDWSGVPDFEFGEYELALDFNVDAGKEFDEPDDDDDAAGFFEAGDENLVDGLYAWLGIIDPEVNQNNSFETATELSSPPGVPAGSRFETISALATPADRDMFRIRTPDDVAGTMSIDLKPLGFDPALFTIVAFNQQRQSIPVTRRFRSTGDVVLEINNIQPNSTYFLRVQSRAGNTLAGNYLLLVNVATLSTNLQRIQSVRLSATEAEQFGEFNVYKTQLFRFDLTMTSVDSTNQACQLSIYSDTGRVEAVTSVRPGQRRTVYVWLQAGKHYLRFNSRSRNNRLIARSTVTLDGASISDDEGPVLLDPSGNPISGPQQPGTNPTPPPKWTFPVFIVGLAIPPENPWQ